MGRFIPRHRLKAGALALPLRACRLGRSVGHLGARLTVRIGVQAAFVGLPYPPPVAAVTAHRVALEVPAHRAIDAKRPSRDCRSGGVKSVEGHPLLQ